MVKPLVSVDGIKFEDLDITDCDSGACPVR